MLDPAVLPVFFLAVLALAVAPAGVLGLVFVGLALRMAFQEVRAR